MPAPCQCCAFIHADSSIASGLPLLCESIYFQRGKFQLSVPPIGGNQCSRPGLCYSVCSSLIIKTPCSDPARLFNAGQGCRKRCCWKMLEERNILRTPAATLFIGRCLAGAQQRVSHADKQK